MLRNLDHLNLEQLSFTIALKYLQVIHLLVDLLSHNTLVKIVLELNQIDTAGQV